MFARRAAVEFQRLDGSSVRLVMADCSGFGSTGLRSWPIVSTVQVFELAEHAHEVSAVDWQTLVGGDFSPSQAEISKMSSSAPRLVTISCAFGGALGFAFVNVAALKRAGWARIRSVRGTPLEFPRFVSESELGELTIVDPSGARRSAEPSECVGLGRGVILTVSQFEEYCRALLGRSLMPHWGRPFGL